MGQATPATHRAVPHALTAPGADDGLLEGPEREPELGAPGVDGLRPGFGGVPLADPGPVAAGDPDGEDSDNTAAPTPHATSTASAASSHRVRDLIQAPLGRFGTPALRAPVLPSLLITPPTHTRATTHVGSLMRQTVSLSEFGRLNPLSG
jgi:hypothetical protein